MVGEKVRLTVSLKVLLLVDGMDESWETQLALDLDDSSAAWTDGCWVSHWVLQKDEHWVGLRDDRMDGEKAASTVDWMDKLRGEYYVDGTDRLMDRKRGSL